MSNNFARLIGGDRVRSAPVHANILLTLTCFVLLLALLLGGGTSQGLISEAIVQLGSLPLLAVALSNISRDTPKRPMFLLFLIISMPLLQLLPLPPEVWTQLPGREEFAQAYSRAGMSLPWAPISLNPGITWRSFLSLLPAAAIFLGSLSLSSHARRLLVILMLVTVFASAILGLLQMLGGEQSPLRFYTITNSSRAVGFFANSNHYAAFLFCAVPFALAWAISADPKRRIFNIGLCGVLLVAIMIGLAISKSRAGLALGLVAGLICLMSTYRTARAGVRLHVLVVGIIGILVAMVILFQFGFVSFSERLDTQGSSDLRWALTSITSQAAQAYFPFGSGFGTFAPIFQKFEPQNLLQNTYVNRAHNDWLEVLLEGGAFSLVIAFVFFGWFTTGWFQAWSKRAPTVATSDKALGLAGGASIVLLSLHSTVDYPLRTTALMAVFALSCTFLILPKGAADSAVEIEGRRRYPRVS